jgi:hypothetical protein
MRVLLPVSLVSAEIPLGAATDPDFPENKEDWLFLRGENEHVVGRGARAILAVSAAIDLAGERP